MKSSFKSVISRLRKAAVRRPNRVEIRAMGGVRLFRAYDVGDDTFVFQRGVWMDLNHHASVLVADKADLKRGARGHLITVTTGNHAVAAIPLLKGQLWDLARLAPEKRTETMMRSVLCANVVAGKLELSQREVPSAKLAALDAWLTDSLGFSLADVVMADRNDETLDLYRRRGQEWRVKPLAWSARDMAVALAASQKRIAASLRYYHGSRGVHFLSFAEFRSFAALARTDFPAFVAGLRELVGVFEQGGVSFARQDKLHGHHEIEFFGVPRGIALERLVPDLEKLLADVDAKTVSQPDAAARADDAVALLRSLLARPELADPESAAFVETLYMYVTGEIYAVMGEGSTPAFDDRRTALPGATFVDGRAVFHPGADRRSRALLSNVRLLTSKDERIEYVNVYELRGDEDLPLGKGSTREIVYKTTFSPVATSVVEKRLSSPGKCYGAYVMCRIDGFKALGVNLPRYRLLRRRGASAGKRCDYYIRSRCEGDPLDDVPAQLFKRTDADGEDLRVVYALAALMGDAAAQNMAMKKRDGERGAAYGVGKEIYEFSYDVRAGRLMPAAVSICSVRGSCGWADLAETDGNFRACAGFYVSAYAESLTAFAKAHPAADRRVLAERFMGGFESRTRAMARALAVRRDDFAGFAPPLPSRYRFREKWLFALWSLERQLAEIDSLKRLFADKFAAFRA